MAGLLLVAAVLLFLPPVATAKVRLLAGPVFAPLQDVTGGWALDLAQEIRQDSRPGRDLQREVPRLVAEVAALQDALAQSAARLDEYERRLRDLAQVRDGLASLPCRLIPARLIAPEVAGGRAGARLVGGAESGIAKGQAVVQRRVTGGSEAGVSRGDPVLTSAGLVGIVDEVGPLTSAVRLLSDPRSGLMVQIITRREDKWLAGPTGVARGSEDGTALRLEGIPRTADVRIGDFVVTSPSPESPAPAYLIVGRIADCRLKPAGLFFESTVEPRVAPAEAGEVFVVAPAP
jgi:cell shape-determining protein MreC